MRLLVIDPSVASLQQITTHLNGAGFGDIQTAHAIDEALGKIATETYDVVLVDLDPTLELDVCRRLRQALRDVPIIVIGHSYQEDLEALFEAGAEDFVARPVRWNELVARIRLVTRRRISAELPAVEEPSSEGRRRSTNTLQAVKVDALTGLPGRTELEAALRAEWFRVGRARRPLALVAVDLDHLEAYNSRHGRAEGDRCLQEITQMLTAGVRHRGDLVARYGDDEFVLLLLDASLEAAFSIAEHVRISIERSTLRITATFGVAADLPRFGIEPTALFSAVGEALYHAKRAGGNRTRAADERTSDESTGAASERRPSWFKNG